MHIRHNGKIIEVVEVEPINSANEIKVYRVDDPNKELFTVSAFSVVREPEVEDSAEDPPPPKNKNKDYAIMGAFGLIVLIAVLNG